MDNDNTIDKRIVKFIREHHVMTLATCLGGVPYCCNLFYAYSLERNSFIFASAESTRHASEFILEPRIAASIVVERKMVGLLRGLQLSGVVERPTESELETIREIYFKSFPFARALSLELWELKMVGAKFTDNRLGFSTKLLWGEMV